MIEARGLIKSFGSLKAVDDISFSIQPGEVVGLLGPNGAGKTTTMRLLTGYLKPDQGSIKIAGFDLNTHPREAKQRLGYLPENPPLYPELSVWESLDFAAGIRGVDKKLRDEKINKALKLTDLLHVKHRLVGNLSKGYRQRVGIAQAIVHEPPFLILDEPTTGLDPKQILEIRELITSLKDHVSILHSSHILQEITQVCDRVMIIHKGKIVADGKISDLTSRLQHKKFVVTTETTDLNAESLKQDILKLAHVLSVEDYFSDLEEVFLKVTQNVSSH